MKIRYDADIIRCMSLFESVTRAKLKDCISNNRLIFIVHENEIGKAIGRNGLNIRKIENMLMKKIRIVEFSPDVIQFVRNMAYPLDVKDIRAENGIITITGGDTRTKALLFGRDSRNLENMKNTVKRYFSINDIRII